MQETKKKNGGGGGNEDSKKKERHIVTWTQEVFCLFPLIYLLILCFGVHINLMGIFFLFPLIYLLVLCFGVLINLMSIWGLQEDDILREQISLHGTEK